MDGMRLDIVPPNDLYLSNFGDGSKEKLKSYLLMMAAFLEGKTKNTMVTYRCALKQFFTLFRWVCPEKVTPAHAAAFKKWLIENQGLSDSTAYCRMSALTSFFDFLCQPTDAMSEPLLKNNPFKLVPRGDIQPTPYAHAKAMQWETFRTIVESIPSNAMGVRDKAILIFLAFTGRRRQEVASLRIRDLDLKSSPRSYTCKTKGGKVRTFELPDICYEAIKAYWIIADRLDGLRGDHGVFTAVRLTPITKHLDPDKPLGVRTFNSILRRAAIRADVDPDDPAIGLHAMRHMSARDLDAAGVRLQDIQAFLGHASPLTTQIYLKQLSGPISAQNDVLMKIREQAVDLAESLI